MTLDELLYFLDLTKEQWDKNKTRYGYKEGEDYAKYFERVHGFSHYDQKAKANESNVSINSEINYIKAELNQIRVNMHELTKTFNKLQKEIVKPKIKETKFY